MWILFLPARTHSPTGSPTHIDTHTRKHKHIHANIQKKSTNKQIFTRPEINAPDAKKVSQSFSEKLEPLQQFFEHAAIQLATKSYKMILNFLKKRFSINMVLKNKVTVLFLLIR